MKWIKCSEKKPTCDRGKNARGPLVLVWPRDNNEGLAFYGRRASVRANFYLYGAVVSGITHWMPMPPGPKG